MTEAKIIEVFWSNAAVDFAGPRLHEWQARVFEEVSGLIADGAGAWFVHAIPPDRADCLLCTGEENASEWRVLVQVATFEPLPQLDDRAASGAQAIQFPGAAMAEDTDLFARYRDLIEP